MRIEEREWKKFQAELGKGIILAVAEKMAFELGKSYAMNFTYSHESLAMDCKKKFIVLKCRFRKEYRQGLSDRFYSGIHCWKYEEQTFYIGRKDYFNAN